jgi:hypothetical protein
MVCITYDMLSCYTHYQLTRKRTVKVLVFIERQWVCGFRIQNIPMSSLYRLHRLLSVWVYSCVCLRGLSPRANYTVRATATCRRT